jgi:hypothetical protein
MRIEDGIVRPRVSGLEVDDQFELGRELDRQISGLLAFEDAVERKIIPIVHWFSQIP